MLSYIKGSLELVMDNYVVVEAGGIGYQVLSSGISIGSLPPVHSQVKLYTYLYVREDELSLYGFVTGEELEVFRLLIGISGIGPKAALSILTALTVNELRMAVLSGDAKAISRANGVGAKGAQRVILDLKDKLKLEDILTSTSGSPTDNGNGSSVYNDTMLALISLGYSDYEAYKALSQVEGRESMDGSQMLKAALKFMSI